MLLHTFLSITAAFLVGMAYGFSFQFQKNLILMAHQKSRLRREIFLLSVVRMLTICIATYFLLRLLTIDSILILVVSFFVGFWLIITIR